MVVINRNLLLLNFYMELYKYICMSWVQVTLSVTLNNVTPLNNLLLNSHFENLTAKLHVLYVFNMHANFYANQMLFTIRVFNPKTHILCNFVNYKNLNLNN